MTGNSIGTSIHMSMHGVVFWKCKQVLFVLYRGCFINVCTSFKKETFPGVKGQQFIHLLEAEAH